MPAGVMALTYDAYGVSRRLAFEIRTRSVIGCRRYSELGYHATRLRRFERLEVIEYSIMHCYLTLIHFMYEWTRHSNGIKQLIFVFV